MASRSKGTWKRKEVATQSGTENQAVSGPRPTVSYRKSLVDSDLKPKVMCRRTTSRKPSGSAGCIPSTPTTPPGTLRWGGCPESTNSCQAQFFEHYPQHFGDIPVFVAEFHSPILHYLGLTLPLGCRRKVARCRGKKTCRRRWRW